MARSKLLTAFYLVVVFLSGALVGGVSHRLYTMSSVSASTAPRSPEEYRRKYLDEMRVRLKLNETQLSQLQVILDGTRKRYHDLHERYRPEMSSIENEHRLQVRAILTDAQRTEYEKMREERERRVRQKQKSSNPGL